MHSRYSNAALRASAQVTVSGNTQFSDSHSMRRVLQSSHRCFSDQSAASTRLSRPRTSLAIFATSGLPTSSITASGSMMSTVVLPPALRTTTLQGSSVLIFRLGLERAVGELRIAGAEDAIGRHLHAKLLLQRCGDVDVAQQAESFLRQLLPDAFERLLEIHVDRLSERIAAHA